MFPEGRCGAAAAGGLQGGRSRAVAESVVAAGCLRRCCAVVLAGRARSSTVAALLAGPRIRILVKSMQCPPFSKRVLKMVGAAYALQKLVHFTSLLEPPPTQF